MLLRFRLGVDEDQLTAGVILEQQFVMRIFEQVLKSAHRGFIPGSFLNDRTLGNFRAMRRFAPAFNRHPDQYRPAVRKPFERGAAESVVDAAIRQAAGSLIGHVGTPQFQSITESKGKGDTPSVRRPAHVPDAGRIRQTDDWACLAAGDLFEHKPRIAR